MDNLNIFNNIFKSIGKDFKSLLNWTTIWINDIRDCVIFNGMMPYFAMFIHGANEVFKITGLKVNGVEIYEKIPIVDKIRSQCIKLYNYDENGVKGSVNKNYEWLINKEKKFTDYYNCFDANNYELYEYENKIINNLHLMEKQLKTDIGTYKDIDQSLTCLIECVIEKIIKFSYVFNNNYIFKNDFDLTDFNFANKVKRYSLKMELKKRSGVYIALIDIMSTINFYNIFIKDSCISQLTKFKMKFVLLSHCATSIININSYEEKTYGYKTLDDCDLKILHYIKNRYVKNRIINICKHYYNNKFDLEVYQSEDFLVKIVEKEFNCRFEFLNNEIDNALSYMSKILNKHFLRFK